MQVYCKITILLAFSFVTVSGQNIIFNPGFEKYYNCPDSYTVEFSKRFIPHWVMPTKGTPDYFNRCSKEMVGVPQNFMGSIFPAEGDGFIGLVLLDTPEVTDEIDYRDYVHSGPFAPVSITNAREKKPNKKRKVKPINYREYVQSQLALPLQPNQLYRISFKYALAQYSTFAVNRLGVAFTEKPITQKAGVLHLKPNVFIDTIVLNSEPGIWVEFADTFRTRGGELYITIGNFYDDKHTQYFPNDISSLNTTLQRTILTNQVAYYYIDDVKVEPVKAGLAANLSPRFIPFSRLKRYELGKIDTLKRYFALLDEVYFDIGQPETNPRSLDQLHWLISYLAEHPNVGLEVNALIHEVETDSIGARSRVASFIRFLDANGIQGNRVKPRILDNLKSLAPKYQFYREGRPCTFYSSLVAIRFYYL